MKHPKKSDKPRPPAHLTDAAKEKWKQFTSAYVFEDPDAILRLEAGLSAWDLCNKHQKILLQEGDLITDRWSQKRAHPSIAICRDARIAMLRAFRELGLDIQAPSHQIGRPPGS